jgi:hypothetical protein
LTWDLKPTFRPPVEHATSRRGLPGDFFWDPAIPHEAVRDLREAVALETIALRREPILGFAVDCVRMLLPRSISIFPLSEILFGVP